MTCTSVLLLRRLRRCFALLLLLTVLAARFSSPASADALDDYIREQMALRHIVGLSLAIVQNGQIVRAQGYGKTWRSENATGVTPSTLFQAASISKAVTALGALNLVEKGKLSLDADVNETLTTWKLPASPFTQDKKVTVRSMLSHTAGITVHGFGGYDTKAPLPTLVQVLNGAPPANSAPIRSEAAPGSAWKYSGGGYTILQQMMLDVTGEAFPQFMQETVLMPLGMTDSAFDQPLSPEKARTAASGYYPNGDMVRGRWHVYPEYAAAGLWTTPTDLAKFAIGIQQALAGKSNPVISATMARQMLTNQKDGDGLGVFLQGSGRILRFSHSGRNEGFDSLLTAYASTGQGAVIMIDANDDSQFLAQVMAAIAQVYRWPGYPLTVNASH